MTATVTRALPGLATPTPGGQIPVRQVIDGDDYDVRLDLADHIDLRKLARAIFTDPAALAEWRVMMTNPSQARTVMAAAELRRMPAIRAALTVTLTPAEAGLAAGCLSERLGEAATEPPRCEWYDDSRGCERFIEGDGELCPMHQAAEDAEPPDPTPWTG